MTTSLNWGASSARTPRQSVGSSARTSRSSLPVVLPNRPQPTASSEPRTVQRPQSGPSSWQNARQYTTAPRAPLKWRVMRPFSRALARVRTWAANISQRIVSRFGSRVPPVQQGHNPAHSPTNVYGSLPKHAYGPLPNYQRVPVFGTSRMTIGDRRHSWSQPARSQARSGVLSRFNTTLHLRSGATFDSLGRASSRGFLSYALPHPPAANSMGAVPAIQIPQTRR
jgi:hypothetical protein